MSDRPQLSIGEFSRLTWLSAKALRLYERRGLLLPDLVDTYTGYRYYRPEQADRARTIALLRRAGMPLGRIGAMLDAPVSDQVAELEAYRVETVHAHERAVALMEDLAARLVEGSPPATSDARSVHIRERPAQRYVSRTLHTTAADLPSHIERASRALMERAGGDLDRAQPLVVQYHGEVSWESDGPIEIQVPIVGAGAADGIDPGGTELFVDVPFGDVQFPTILRSFDIVREAATRGARQLSGSPREIYYEGSPFRCEVAQGFVTAAN